MFLLLIPEENYGDVELPVLRGGLLWRENGEQGEDGGIGTPYDQKVGPVTMLMDLFFLFLNNV